MSHDLLSHTLVRRAISSCQHLLLCQATACPYMKRQQPYMFTLRVPDMQRLCLHLFAACGMCCHRIQG